MHYSCSRNHELLQAQGLLQVLQEGQDEFCGLHLKTCQCPEELNDASADPTTSAYRKKALEKSLELAITAKELAEKTIPKKGKNFFPLYKMLLGDNAQVKWSRIVDAKIGAAPWTDLQGNVQDIACEHSVQSFKYCVTFHLLSVLSNDAAERQK